MKETGKSEEYHRPVLLKETIDFLNIRKGEKYLDATVGGGGHAEAILRAGGRVLGIDCDPEALEYSRKRLTQACPLGASKWTLVKGNFRDLAEIAHKANFEKIAGILFDLGFSSHQIEKDQRGFSFDSAEELDMRMDLDLKVKAVDLVNGLHEGELNELFTKLGEEHYSRAIADALCRARGVVPIKTCRQLAELVVEAVPKKARFGRIHPATRVFQALRIAVNDELNNLRQALPQTAELLNSGGRLVVISFHSLEDGLVKKFMRQMAEQNKFKLLTLRPVETSQEERLTNARSRSAKLRAAERK